MPAGRGHGLWIFAYSGGDSQRGDLFCWGQYLRCLRPAPRSRPGKFPMHSRDFPCRVCCNLWDLTSKLGDDLPRLTQRTQIVRCCCRNPCTGQNSKTKQKAIYYRLTPDIYSYGPTTTTWRTHNYLPMSCFELFPRGIHRLDENKHSLNPFVCFFTPGAQLHRDGDSGPGGRRGFCQLRGREHCRGNGLRAGAGLRRQRLGTVRQVRRQRGLGAAGHGPLGLLARHGPEGPEPARWWRD